MNISSYRKRAMELLLFRYYPISNRRTADAALLYEKGRK